MISDLMQTNIDADCLCVPELLSQQPFHMLRVGYDISYVSRLTTMNFHGSLMQQT